MCGIGGIYSPKGEPINHQTLKRMGDAIAHRGPDGEGFFLDDGIPSVGMVNRRLAVIDLDGGAQPITIEDGAFAIVYNGELFNTLELRRVLEHAGHRFHTSCDTEVVVRGYAQWGEGVLERLDGMWAFAIWERDERRLFLARDRLGIKPLVYAVTPHGIAFGSEIKSIIASGLVRPELDPTALPHYLSAFAVPEPLTLFRNVRRLPAGYSLMLTADDVREREYWDCAISEEPDQGRARYVEEVSELLEDSVRRTMVSDVPLGVLLSGGVDSRLLATFAAQATDRLETFTLGFDDPVYDERPAARAIAQRLGATHRDAEMDLQAGSAALRSLVEVYDEPGQSLIQTHFISQFARQHVTVALSGVGGDELFAAYPTHVATSVLARLDAVPTVVAKPFREAAKLSPIRRIQRLAALSAMEPDERVTHELFHQTSAALRSDLLSPSVAAEVDLSAPVKYLAEHMARATSRDPLNRLLYLYLKTYLPNELLRSADAMSMLSSLELRVPFLNHRLVERAMAIPSVHKMRFRQGKLLLHDIANQTMADPTSHIKRGFSPPLATWLRGDLGLQVYDTLSRDAIRTRGIFDPDAVARVVRRALAGDTSLVPAVMMLYSFEIWAQKWLAPSFDSTSHDARELCTHTEPAPDLSIVIVSWNTVELTRAALQSLRDHLGAVRHEVIVVDNHSSDGSQEMVSTEFPEVRLIANSQNVGFGRANNQGMGVARARWLLLLNSDAALTDNSVVRLLEHVKLDPSIGLAHCRLLSPDGSLQHTTYRFPSIKVALLDSLGLSRFLGAARRADLLGGYWDQSEERDVDAVAGAFMLLRREVYEDTQGFDERIFMYGEDIEWCSRIWEAGWRVRFYPQASVIHHDHASTSKSLGDNRRITLSLSAQVSLVQERQGRIARSAYLALLILGTALRLGYYSLRSTHASSAGDRYKAMIPFQRASFRSMYEILRRRA